MNFRLCGQLALSLLTGCMVLAPAGHAASVPPLAGSVLGDVRNAAGIAQMGATVLLYDRYDRLVRQSLSNETGKFVFESLVPGPYSIRVLLASFAPLMRRNIMVAAGSENLLYINLATVLSTLELAPASEARGALMNDDWKWVLRTSHSTRPTLRLLPAGGVSSSGHRSMASVFSETTGVFRVSGGDGDPSLGSSAQDMGTAFALSTLINGSARVRLSGNLGYMSNSGLPDAGFRATYSHDRDGLRGPQISLTAHQVYFPGLGHSANANGSENGDQESGPVLRTISIGAMDTLQLTDELKFEYGARMESVSFLNRVSYLSPFARASYDLGAGGMARVAFSSGTEPAELIGHDSDGPSAELSAAELNASGLNQDLAALSMLPRVSRSGGHMHLQRTQNWEAGYSLVRGSRKYSASMYREDVADAAYTMSPEASFLSRADVLPDLDSRNYLFDIGGYQRSGYSGAVRQSIGEYVNLTLAAGRGGALVADPGRDPAESADGVRAQIHKATRSWVTARASATLPGSGTRLVTSYGWTDFRSLMPVHYSLTETTNQDEGWNVVIHQPLPRVGSMRGRLEATAELRNALAQGYLPIHTDGRSMILTNSPRALRGGLNFLF